MSNDDDVEEVDVVTAGRSVKGIGSERQIDRRAGRKLAEHRNYDEEDVRRGDHQRKRSRHERFDDEESDPDDDEEEHVDDEEEYDDDKQDEHDYADIDAV